MVDEHAHVDLQSDEKQEQDEAEVGHQVDDDHRVGGEDGFLEPGDAEHDGGAEDDTAYDFGDDDRLADVGEGPLEGAAEYDDDACLGAC
jgi:hypothetical protein